MGTKLLYLFLLFNLNILGAVIAQEDFFRPGTEWYYGFNNPGLVQARGYTLYRFEKDTVIDAHQLKKLNLTTYYFDLQNPTILIDTFIYPPVFFKQSGDSILEYDAEESQLTLHWINGLDPGDIFLIDKGWYPGSDEDVLTMEIDSIQDITIGGIPVAKTYLHGSVYYIEGGDTLLLSGGGKAIIYDKFGPTSGFAYWVCWDYLDCYSPTLCRYVSNETGEVEISTSSKCASLVTSTSEIISSPFNIYPNPFSDYLIIDHSEPSSDIKFQLVTQAGLQIFSTTLQQYENNIDVSLIPAGMYFYRVNDSKYVIAGKLVKE